MSNNHVRVRQDLFALAIICPICFPSKSHFVQPNVVCPAPAVPTFWTPGQLASLEGIMEGEDTKKGVEEKHEESEEEEDDEKKEKKGRFCKAVIRFLASVGGLCNVHCPGCIYCRGCQYIHLF